MQCMNPDAVFFLINETQEIWQWKHFDIKDVIIISTYSSLWLCIKNHFTFGDTC